MTALIGELKQSRLLFQMTGSQQGGRYVQTGMGAARSLNGSRLLWARHNDELSALFLSAGGSSRCCPTVTRPARSGTTNDSINRQRNQAKVRYTWLVNKTGWKLKVQVGFLVFKKEKEKKRSNTVCACAWSSRFSTPFFFFFFKPREIVAHYRASLLVVVYLRVVL